MKLDLDLTQEQVDRIKNMLAEEEEEKKDIEFVDIPKRSYSMGKYPVTQRQWLDVMGSLPDGNNDNDKPVVNVSWNDVVEFCRLLSERDGCFYRLPSEDEWEYAARAGEGDPEDIDEYAWHYENSSSEIKKVGLKKPNAWGLYDMLGNVWEWTNSEY